MAAMDPALLADGGLRLEVDGPVATVVLDRPEARNAQTPATWAALAAVGDTLDPSVRVVVVRGEGPSFCAGIDRRMLTPEGVPGGTSFARLLELDDDALADRIAEFQRGFSWWRRPERVTIAAVHGHAIGAGFQLALACDLRIMADDAQLCMREPALGLVPDLGGTQPLVEIVGYSRALEMVATTRFVGADEAAELGLATAVVPGSDLLDAVRDLAAALVAPPHGAVSATKELLLAAGRRSYDEQLRAERLAQVGRLRAMGAGTTV
ncbi:MAG: enoyl-CoA hydratase/isomerase family protein [Propionibacteriales bacterium]|nr:enoyl-CoA hydratase/isomerase family protein [Propionibacteriales bacterium]